MPIQKIGVSFFALVGWLNRSHKVDRIELCYAESRFGEFEMPEMNGIKRPAQQT
jgi:hypothetical protein